MSYGFEFYNNSDQLVIDDTFVKPWFTGKGTYASVAVSTDYVIADFTVYRLSYTPPSGSGVIYLSLPANSVTNVAYCLDNTTYTSGSTIYVYAAVSVNYSPTSADIPQVFCFSLDYITNLSSGYGAKIFDESSRCVFDTGARHLKIDTASDNVFWANSFYSLPGGTVSKSGYASSIENTAFFLPKIESDELVNNGDGTFTRNKYLGFYSRYGTDTTIWQPKVQTENKSGTLSFSGSKVFNNKDYYDITTQILPTSCYATPLVIDYGTYDPSSVTVNWPSASYTLTLYEPVTSGNVVTEGTFQAGIRGAVTTTNISPNTTLRYVFSGTNITASDFSTNSLEGTFVIANDGTATFDVGVSNDFIYEGNETAVCTITRINGNAITGTSASITIAEGPTSYTIATNTTSVNEGDSFTVTCTSNKTSANGLSQTLNYTISQLSGNSFDTNDWTGTVTLGSGSSITANRFVIGNGQSSTSRTFYPATDYRPDGAKVLRVQLDDYSGTGTYVDVTINDTSTAYTWTLNGSTSVYEGSTYTYTVTTNAPSGTRALITLQAPYPFQAAADINDISYVNGQTVTAGTAYYVTTTNGSGSFTVTYKADNTTEGYEYFTLALIEDTYPYTTKLCSLSGGVVTIYDTSLTPAVFSFSVSPTNVDEGSSIGISWSFQNYSSYPLLLYFVITGDNITGSDFSIGVTTGSYWFNSPSGTDYLGITADHLTEGTEYATLTWYSDSQHTYSIGNQVTWSINDTSLSYPAYGTYVSQFCSGYNLYYTYNDGAGGTYNQLAQSNSSTCGYVSYPAYGIYVTQFCSGFDLYYTYTDGNGGTFNQLAQSNSSTCGYVPEPAVWYSPILSYQSAYFIQILIGVNWATSVQGYYTYNDGASANFSMTPLTQYSYVYNGVTYYQWWYITFGDGVNSFSSGTYKAYITAYGPGGSKDCGSITAYV